MHFIVRYGERVPRNRTVDRQCKTNDIINMIHVTDSAVWLKIKNIAQTNLVCSINNNKIKITADTFDIRF